METKKYRIVNESLRDQHLAEILRSTEKYLDQGASPPDLYLNFEILRQEIIDYIKEADCTEEKS